MHGRCMGVFAAVVLMASTGPVGSGSDQRFTSSVAEPVRVTKTVAEVSGEQPVRTQGQEVNKRRRHGGRQSSSSDPGQHASSAQVGSGKAPGFTLNVDGLDFTGAFPPDTVGEAGTLHYVQMVNDPSGGSRVGVYDKASGAELANFVLSSLAPPGSPCTNAAGDPVVIFDQLASRWILTEFLSPVEPQPGVCMYVFDGADLLNDNATLYAFGTQAFPDYPKWSVWPDAIYFAANESDANGPTPAVYAIDRSKVLAAQATTIIRGQAPPLDGFGFQILAPVDLDGTATPPASAPGAFIRHRDDEVHNAVPAPGTDSLEYFEFAPNFGNPANSTFLGPTPVAISEFSSELCGLFSFECIRQKKTRRRLDPLREVVMHRPTIRTFGTHQSLVGSFATDVDGAETAGVRWFELRRGANDSAGAWTLHQEGTVGTAGDQVSRWMSSIAMNGAGDIALGYSVSGPKSFPSIAVTGRRATDPVGTMPQGEATMTPGTKSQKKSERWGDYSAMTVDPSDDSTFWYTNEVSGRKSLWQTKIGHFSLN